jgi:UDP-N-acetylglucosamine 4,6-dehydratase
MLNNKSILVTGATGFFGKNFVQYIVKNFNPRRLVVFSRDEQKHYNLINEFKDNKKFGCLRFFIGDIRDKDRVNFAFKDVDYVVHAAAMKHVPLSEENPYECIKTNIIGAENVISASINNKVQKVIALSTDKAVNPINLYGATKLCSDKLFIAARNIVGKNPTIFSVVRYGNVVGSTGSVLPYYLDLIKNKNTTLPITDLKMTRFWYQLDRGLEFVMSSFSYMKGGEIFVPKIPSIKILDLIRSFGKNIKAKEIGIRPGEKINEIMCPKDESYLTLEFNKYFIIAPDNFYISKVKKNSFKFVEKNFEYSSDNNSRFLSVKEIQNVNKDFIKNNH